MKGTRYIAALAGSVFLLLLCACGGGGGGTSPSGAGTGTAQTISGTITVNGVGLAGVQVSIPGQEPRQTDGNGAYLFTHVLDGSYAVTPTSTSYKFTPGSTTVTVAGNAAVADFSATYTSFAVYGKVLAQDGSGLAGATVTATRGGSAAGSAVTDGSGSYSIGPLAAGPYDVSVSHPRGYTIPAQTVTVTDLGVAAQFSAPVATTYKIHGKVTYQADGTARGGLGINLYSGSASGYGGTPLHTVTDSTGGYAFSGLPGDTLYGYRVVPDLVPGYNADPYNPSFFITGDTTQDFLLWPPGNGSVGGNAGS